MGNSVQALLRFEKAAWDAHTMGSQTTPSPLDRERCGLAILCFCVETVVLQATESIEQNQDDDAHPDCQDREHNNKLLAIHTRVPSH